LEKKVITLFWMLSINRGKGAGGGERPTEPRRSNYARRGVATSPHPEADQASAPSTRARLLSAAYDLLVRDGYQATTVQAVARRAGMTTGAIYANFANKQELMALAVLNNWNHLQERQWADLLGPDGAAPGPVALLRYVARLVAEPAGPEHRALTEVTGAVLRDPEPSPLLTSLHMFEQLLRIGVEQGKADGTFAADHPTEALVALLRAVYLGAITSKSWGLEQPDADDINGILEAIAAGLAPGTP
jgi:AcrR family transcriptional regulator